MEQPKNKRGFRLLVIGALSLSASLIGLYTAYYYSWRITVPGLPVDIVEKYDTISRVLGISSLVIFAVSLGLLGMGLWYRRQPRYGKTVKGDGGKRGRRD